MSTLSRIAYYIYLYLLSGHVVHCTCNLHLPSASQISLDARLLYLLVYNLYTQSQISKKAAENVQLNDLTLSCSLKMIIVCLHNTNL